MQHSKTTPGIVSNRLAPEVYDSHFGDLTPVMTTAEAGLAAERCFICQDAPCIPACPAEIDIPGFIRQIKDGHPESAAETIFDQNILGGICARVCPVDTLCEAACIRTNAEEKPVEIARLQRFATDKLQQPGIHPINRAPETGKKIAVIGAGPAGLACAHKLASLGHGVEIFEAKEKPGGLNEYGIAAYKTPNGFAQAEVAWLLQIGGISVTCGIELGREITLDQLRESHDAVFLSIGLAGVNSLRAEGEHHANVEDAIDFIARLRQAPEISEIAIGRNVVVIGGGMTAVDAAVQAKLLGAEHVTMVYRGEGEAMGISDQERLYAVSKGVRIITGAVPARILGNGQVDAVEFAYSKADDTGLRPGGETFRLPADQVFKAIGQCLDEAPGGLRLDGQKIAVDEKGRCSIAGVWAGGDCAASGA
ncbi:MAG: NAD(P)-dependent oxidoreductase, partial [Mangrovicoccus sp.]